jgi:hypothetical protein
MKREEREADITWVLAAVLLTLMGLFWIHCGGEVAGGTARVAAAATRALVGD